MKCFMTHNSAVIISTVSDGQRKTADYRTPRYIVEQTSIAQQAVLHPWDLHTIPAAISFNGNFPLLFRQFQQQTGVSRCLLILYIEVMKQLNLPSKWKAA
jgi:hypothetical protein